LFSIILLEIHEFPFFSVNIRANISHDHDLIVGAISKEHQKIELQAKSEGGTTTRIPWDGDVTP